MTFLAHKKVLLAIGSVAALMLGGCGGTPIIPAESWTLPAKAKPETAMLIGRLGLPDNKHLNLQWVTVQEWGKMYMYSGTVPKGETNFVMDNNYFVVPNLKPGKKYYFAGFAARGAYNSFPANKEDFIELKAGEVRFVGSFDYSEGSTNTLREVVRVPGTFSVKPAKQPSELEMLRWLLRVGNGSGWEPAVKQRIKQLGGKV
jgi:hypothetical protein